MPSKPCPHMATCALYPLFNLKGTLRVWQLNYCEGQYDNCARFIRTSEGKVVPDNLLPNGKLLVLDPRVVRK